MMEVSFQTIAFSAIASGIGAYVGVTMKLIRMSTRVDYHEKELDSLREFKDDQLSITHNHAGRIASIERIVK